MRKGEKESFADLAWVELFSGKWYDFIKKEDDRFLNGTISIELKSSNEISDKIKELYKASQAIYAENAEKFDKIRKEDTEFKFIQKAIASGTFKDKMSSLSLAAQQCPILSKSYIYQLEQLSLIKRKEEAQKALEAFKDMLIEELLPTSRKLYFFHEQPSISSTTLQFKLREYAMEKCPGKLRSILQKAPKEKPVFLPAEVTPLQITLTHKELISFFFEDWLKGSYSGYVQLLAASSIHSVDFVKQNSIAYACELAAASPEHRVSLLTLALNKLGDTTVTAKAVSSLASSLSKKPRELKPLVVDAANEILSRPSLVSSSRYRVVLFLSELQLKRNFDVELAQKLIRIYVASFELALGEMDPTKEQRRVNLDEKKKEIREKFEEKTGKNMKQKKLMKKVFAAESTNSEIWQSVLKATLIGLRRALPFATCVNQTTPLVLDENTSNILYRAVHTAPTAALRIEIMALLFATLDQNSEVSDRFYRALYEQIQTSCSLESRSRSTLIRLVSQAIAFDPNHSRAISMVRRLLQVGIHMNDHSLTTHQILATLARTALHHSAIKDLVVLKEQELKENVEEEYDISKRDPKYSNADNLPLWELEMYCSLSHPQLRQTAKELLENMANTSANNPNKSKTNSTITKQIAQSFITQLAKDDGINAQITHRLDSLFQEEGAEEQNNTQKGGKKKKQENSNNANSNGNNKSTLPIDQGDLLDAMAHKVRDHLCEMMGLSSKNGVNMNSTEFWEQLRHTAIGVPSYLGFMDTYYSDPNVIRRLEKKGEGDEEDAFEEMDEADAADAFLDDILAQENGQFDDEEAEEDEDWGEEDWGEEGEDEEAGVEGEDMQGEEESDLDDVGSFQAESDDGESVSSMEGLEFGGEEDDEEDDMPAMDMEMGEEEDETTASKKGKVKSSGSAFGSMEDYLDMIDADQRNADGYEEGMSREFQVETDKNTKRGRAASRGPSAMIGNKSKKFRR